MFDSARILVTGITSIHGWPIYSTLCRYVLPQNLFGIRPPKTNTPQGKNIAAICITNKHALLQIKDAFQPTHVIHCAGVCDLDVCEQRPAWAHALNVLGTQNLVEVFKNSAYIMHLSTDLVFSGVHAPAGGYTEKHTPDPVNVVGKTFTIAEQSMLQCSDYCIIRLGLPLGDSIHCDKGAINWIEGRLKKKRKVTLFVDEFRSCIWCDDIGILCMKACAMQIQGLIHLGGVRQWSLYEIGEFVLDKGGYDSGLLQGIMRSQEINGPPRVGNVSLDSSYFYSLVGSPAINAVEKAPVAY